MELFCLSSSCSCEGDDLSPALLIKPSLLRFSDTLPTRSSTLSQRHTTKLSRMNCRQSPRVSSRAPQRILSTLCPLDHSLQSLNRYLLPNRLAVSPRATSRDSVSMGPPHIVPKKEHVTTGHLLKHSVNSVDELQRSYWVSTA
jgi:hypothetical protein